MLLIDASTSLLQIGQTFNGDSSKGVGKRPFSMRIADQIKRQWVAIFDENHRPDSMRFGGHFSREYALTQLKAEANRMWDERARKDMHYSHYSVQHGKADYIKRRDGEDWLRRFKQQ